MNKNTNGIDTAGYAYVPNGNMTTMPLMTAAYDVANRMVTSNHSSAGTQDYGYNHANQRVFVRNGNTVTYYLYGMGGERLMEMQETCTTSCTGYAENQRWIYFAGGKMFQKTGTTLKAVTPNRLASEAKHFPYGEIDGTPPSDTKDYFATYRRDGTGLDYAWNRYYSPTMGRFTTADPGPEDYRNPGTLNRYVYGADDPINYYDGDGRLFRFLGKLLGKIGQFFGYSPSSGEAQESQLGGGDSPGPIEAGSGGGRPPGETDDTPTTATITYDDGSAQELGDGDWNNTQPPPTFDSSNGNINGPNNTFVVIDIPLSGDLRTPAAYTGPTFLLFHNANTGTGCIGAGWGFGVPHAGIQVGQIGNITQPGAAQPEDVLEGIGTSYSYGLGHVGAVFQPIDAIPGQGAMGSGYGSQGPSASVGYTGCFRP